MDAVDRLFAEFELVFHNQYHKAYPTQEKLHYAKKLWFDYLRDYSPAVILAAARQAVRNSEFLPSVASLLKYCGQAAAPELPDTYSAYREACMAPSPKASYGWSHPAVYYAGCACGWQVLSSQQEKQALPVFSRHYEALCERIARGETLADPAAPSLAHHQGEPLDREENQRRLRQLRRDTGL